MKYYHIITTLIIALFVSSCVEPSTEELVAVGGKKYGGEFKFMSEEKVTNLLPTSSATQYSSRLISQIFESLLQLDPKTMAIMPGIAESFKVSGDAKVYTFNIRKGVIFHDDDCLSAGHKLDANDVKFSLDLACSGLEVNSIGYLLINRIQGGIEFNKKSKTSLPKGGVSGIKVINNHTVQITLVNSFSGFENILTHSSLGVFPQEAWDKYGKEIGKHPVGTGPFALESMEDEKIVLKRNNSYWRKDELGNQLPFLSKVIATYAKNKKSELLAFRNSSSDLVMEVPVEVIENILGTLLEAQEGKNIKHRVESEPSMSMGYIAMAIDSKEFSDVRVRKAFNIAVDREVIVNDWIDGEGWAATHGFVPKMTNYPIENVKGHVYNPEKAKALMKEAGYPNGENFPTLDFYVNTTKGSTVFKAASGVAYQLKQTLNVNLNIKLVTLDEREAAIKSGKAKIWRAGWIADYPDAENFLAMFYSGNIMNESSMMNNFKFKDAEYDALFQSALLESDNEKRISLMVECDQMVVDKAAIMPLRTEDHIVLVNARIRDFKANSMESINLTNVFIKESKK